MAYHLWYGHETVTKQLHNCNPSFDWYNYIWYNHVCHPLDMNKMWQELGHIAKLLIIALLSLAPHSIFYESSPQFSLIPPLSLPPSLPPSLQTYTADPHLQWMDVREWVVETYPWQSIVNIGKLKTLIPEDVGWNHGGCGLLVDVNLCFHRSCVPLSSPTFSPPTAVRPQQSRLMRVKASLWCHELVHT